MYPSLPTIYDWLQDTKGDTRWTERSLWVKTASGRGEVTTVPLGIMEAAFLSPRNKHRLNLG